MPYILWLHYVIQSQCYTSYNVFMSFKHYKYITLSGILLSKVYRNLKEIFINRFKLGHVWYAVMVIIL